MTVPLAVGETWAGDALSKWSNQSAPDDAYGKRVVLSNFNGGMASYAMAAYAEDVAPLTPNANPRAQLRSPDLMVVDGVYKITQAICFPTGCMPKTLPAGGWIEFVQFNYGQPYAGSPAQRLMTLDGQKWGLRLADSLPFAWETPIVFDAWWWLTYQFRLSATAGWWQLFVTPPGGTASMVASANAPTIIASDNTGPWAYYLDAYMAAGTADRIGPFYFNVPTIQRVS